MIYLQAGLFAEGSTDYEFLLPLLGRLLGDLSAKRYAGAIEVPDPIGIDADPSARARRRGRIADALERAWDRCHIFIIHADADGDTWAAREERINPGVEDARRKLEIVLSQGHSAAEVPRELLAVACIPVREIEAWMLTDETALRRIVGSKAVFKLPLDPEKERYPDKVLDSIFVGLKRKRPMELYAFLGNRVSLDSLRRLTAFREFEAELSRAIEAVGRQYGAV